MNILHYRKRFSPISETFIYDYIKGLSDAGVNCHVATHYRKNRESRPLSPVHVASPPSLWNLKRLLRRIRFLGQPNAGPRSLWPPMRRGLERIVEQVRPDVIHAHFGGEGVQIAPIAKRFGIPLVVTFYGYDISSLPSRPYGGYDTSAYKTWAEAYLDLWAVVDAVTVLSKQMKSAALDLGCPEEKIHVVRLSRDLRQFPFFPPNQPAKRILFLGRLTAKKAPLDAVKAVELVNQRGANVTLDIVGDGKLHEELEEYIADRNLAKYVTLHGRVPNEKISDYMREADIFLLPSKTAPDGDQEGTPTVLIEAQASGLPCVSTQHAGIPEMIPSENHDFLAPEGDVAELASILKDLSSRSVEELVEVAERGRRKVEEEFNLTQEIDKLQTIYQSLQE